VLVSLVVLAAFVAGALVLWWRSTLAGQTIQVSVRVVGTETSVGRPAEAELSIANTGKRASCPVQIEDPRTHWALSHPGLGHRGEVSSSGQSRLGRLGRIAESRVFGDPIRLRGLSPGARVAVRIPIPTSARGLLTLSPLGIWCEDPLRLLVWKVGSGPPTHVLVCPVPDPSAAVPKPTPSGLGARPTEAGELEPISPVQAGYEFRSIRPYVAGDRMTRLHWPAFARTGELAVRDFVEPVAGCVTILVDLRPSVHRHAGPSASGAPIADQESVEAVISSAAGVGARALQLGRVVELCTSAGDRVEIAPGHDAAQRLLSALAVLGPASPGLSSALRWSRTTDGAAVWSTSNYGTADVVLVSTSAGAESALPQALATRAERIVAS